MADLMAGGLRFNVVRMGAGAAQLVLIHGLVMDSHASFYLSIAPALGQHARVLLYDLRGHGRSEQPATGYTMDDMVADLMGILDAAGLAAEPVVLVGNSFGGQIALRAAARYPSRVRALVLIDPQLGIPDFRAELAEVAGADAEERDRKAYDLFGRWLSEHTADRAGRPEAAGATFVERRSATIDDVVQHRKRRRSPGVRTALGLARDTSLVADLARETAMGDPVIASVHCPTLAIFGERSELRDDAQRLTRLMADVEVAWLPGMGHTVLIEAPTPLRDTIVAWLARRMA